MQENNKNPFLDSGTQPPQQQPLPTPEPDTPHYVVADGQKCSLAIASLACGVIGLFCCGLLSIAAVICGHMARDQIQKSNGALAGDGMAIAGLITGYLGIAFNIIWLLIQATRFAA